MRQPSDAHIRTGVGIAWIVSDLDIGSHILRRSSIWQRHGAHSSAFGVPGIAIAISFSDTGDEPLSADVRDDCPDSVAFNLAHSGAQP